MAQWKRAYHFLQIHIRIQMVKKVDVTHVLRFERILLNMWTCLLSCHAQASISRSQQIKTIDVAVMPHCKFVRTTNTSKFLFMSELVTVKFLNVQGWGIYLTNRTRDLHMQRWPDSQFPCRLQCSPRGSVLGPRCFISYTEDVVDLLEEHSVHSHLYANDT